MRPWIGGGLGELGQKNEGRDCPNSSQLEWHQDRGRTDGSRCNRSSGLEEGGINVHSVWNRITGAVGDFKIIMPGSRPSGGPCR